MKDSARKRLISKIKLTILKFCLFGMLETGLVVFLFICIRALLGEGTLQVDFGPGIAMCIAATPIILFIGTILLRQLIAISCMHILIVGEEVESLASSR